MEGFSRRTHQKGQDKFFLVIGRQLLTDLITQYRLQAPARSIPQEGVFPNGTREDPLVETQDKQGTKGNATCRHGIQHGNTGKIPIC